MAWHWRDVREPQRPEVWRGLRVTAPDVRPTLRTQACRPGCISIVAGSRPRLWARIADDYWDYELLRAADRDSLGVLPPIVAAWVQQVANVPASERLSRWARLYGQLLESSPLSPIHEGDWFLGLHGPRLDRLELTPKLVRQTAEQKPAGCVAWDIGGEPYPITLRSLSSPDAGRVKSWRKHARAGSLPPILLHWISGLAAYVILDGHDRLLAAALEGDAAPALTLERISDSAIDVTRAESLQRILERELRAADQLRAQPPSGRLARPQRLLTVESTNQMLLDEFTPRLTTPRSRAWPLPGGAGAWAREVHAAASAQGIDARDLLRRLEHHLH